MKKNWQQIKSGKVFKTKHWKENHKGYRETVSNALACGHCCLVREDRYEAAVLEDLYNDAPHISKAKIEKILKTGHLDACARVTDSAD